MTGLLEAAFAEAAELPQPEQDAFARFMLQELREDRAWERAFAASLDKLEELADEALAEHRAGLTEPF